MTELKPDGKIGKTINVSENFPMPKPSLVSLGVDENISPDKVEKIIHDNFSMANEYLIYKSDHQILEPRLKYVDEHAKHFINYFREQCGLPIVQIDKMRCAYFTDPEYETSKDLLSPFGFSKDRLGIQNNVLATQCIKINNLPAYYVGSIAVHELAHEWLEHTTTVYKTSVSDRKPRTLSAEQIQNGLSSKNVINGKHLGGVVNELGNYYIQMEYLRAVLKSPVLELKDEIENRQHLLKNLMGDNKGASITYTSTLGRKEEIVIDTDKIHFDNNGNQVITPMATMYMQLADDINFLCTEEGQDSFMDQIVKSKTDPKLLHNLKMILDEKIDKGFSNRLMYAKYESEDDLLNLLAEVQSIIYRDQ